MAMDAELIERVEKAIRHDGRYPPEAFEFLHQGLERAVRAKRTDYEDTSRHVSGQELCEALRLEAINRWGALAGTVLRSWNVRGTRDFGEMVYLMVRLGLMGKQESDSIDDFDDVYDFRDAFGRIRIEIDTDDDEG